MTLSVWIIILCMVGLNALLAAYEIALASVSLGRLKVLFDEHRKGAKAAMHMKENMEASLAVVQLGITLVGAIAAATGGAGADDSIAPIIREHLDLSPPWAHALSLALFVIPLSAVTIVGGELIPKVFALPQGLRAQEQRMGLPALVAGDAYHVAGDLSGGMGARS